MNWQPIETYDALNKKPEWAIFYFTERKSRDWVLRERIEQHRFFGDRTCTYWMELPEPPK
jgi:hypothetical protein